MKKNKKLTLLVAILLVGIGVAFAYFVGKTLFDGKGAVTKATTANINGAELIIDGAPQLEDLNMYPGHRTITKITATATGDNQLVVFNLEWVGTNSLTTPLNFKIYRSETEIENISTNCEVKTKVQNGAQYLNEECTITNETQLTDLVGSGTVESKAEQQTISLAMNEMITATESGNTIYYYLILEYPNLDSNQNGDLEGSFSGKVQGVASDAEADVNIIGVYINNEKVDSLPTSEENYILDEEQSTCTNEAKPTWDESDWSLVVNNLNKSGTDCSLYFKNKPTSKDVLDNLGITPEEGIVDSFTGPSCNNNSNCGGTINMNQNGVYEAEDDFGTSYYYRGTVDNNWLVFGKDTSDGDKYIWWRIIRINGNGTIRLIYAGTSSDKKTAPSTQGVDTMITPRQNIGGSSYPRAVRFNTNYNDNKYVGYMFGGQDGQISASYETAHKPETKSTILDEIVYWYENKTNLKELATKIDVDTGFCGDRTYTTTNHGPYYPGTGDLGWKNTATVYGGEKVWQSESPSWKTDEQIATFKCGVDYKTKEVSVDAQKRDLYTGPNATVGGTKGIDGKVEGNNALPVPVGLITMDEVIHAGGFAGQANNGCWLYTNQYYWTMSPHFYPNAVVFSVYRDGSLGSTDVNGNNYGARPVINLKSTVKIKIESDGDPGTSTNPYIVVTE